MFIPFVALHPRSFCDKIPEKSLPEGNNLEQQIIDVLNQFVAVKNEYNQQEETHPLWMRFFLLIAN